jgi:hypothetical protein
MICNECETVAHCLKNGCVPKQPTKDRALKLALEALESCDASHITDGGNQWHDEKLVDKAITAIKQALEQPVQQSRSDVEPVAWLVERQHFGFRDHGLKFGPFWKLDDAIEWCDSNHVLRELYTTPPAAPVPEEWRLVPAKLTEAMQDAAMAYVYINGFTRGDGPHNVYRAMLAAAPTPPAAQRQWVEVSDEELLEAYGWSGPCEIDFIAAAARTELLGGLRKVEAKLKEKNT